MKTALIAGGSGLVGGRLLRLLLDAPEYSAVAAAVRRPLGLGHPKLKEVELPPGAPAASPGPDEVFCCLGTTLAKAGGREAFRAVDYELPLALARWAAESGAKRFHLVTSLGADPRSRVFYSRVKGEVEEAVAAAGVPSVAIYRPALLLGERRESRPAERVAQALLPLAAPLLVGPLRDYRPVLGETVARAMLRVAGEEAIPGATVFESARLAELGAQAS